MIEPSNEDIAEALRLSDYWPFASAPIVRDFAKIGASQAVNCLAHARTIAKLRIAVEALEFYADENNPNPNDGPWGSGSDDWGDKARASLDQIKGQSNEQAD